MMYLDFVLFPINLSRNKMIYYSQHPFICIWVRIVGWMSHHLIFLSQVDVYNVAQYFRCSYTRLHQSHHTIHSSSFQSPGRGLMGNKGSAGLWFLMTSVILVSPAVCHLHASPQVKVDATTRLSPLATSPSRVQCGCIHARTSHLHPDWIFSMRVTLPHTIDINCSKHPCPLLYPSFIFLYCFSFIHWWSHWIIISYVLLLPCWSVQKFSKYSGMP